MQGKPVRRCRIPDYAVLAGFIQHERDAKFSLALFGPDRDVTPVTSDDPAAQIKSQAGPLARGFGRKKRIKNSVHVFRRDACAIIFKTDQDLVGS